MLDSPNEVTSRPYFPITPPCQTYPLAEAADAHAAIEARTVFGKTLLLAG